MLRSFPWWAWLHSGKPFHNTPSLLPLRPWLPSPFSHTPVLTAYQRRVHGWLPGPGGIPVFFLCSNDKLIRAERGWRGLDLWYGSRMRLCWKANIGSWFCRKSMCFLQLTFTSNEANILVWTGKALGPCQNSKEQRKGHGAPQGRHNHCPYFVEKNQTLKDEQHLCVSSSQITTLTLDTDDVRSIILQLLKLPVWCLLTILWCLFGGMPQEGSFCVMGEQMFTFAK